MDILTIDFETYYAKDYGLRKLTTEEYIRDPRFEVIGVAIKKKLGQNYHQEKLMRQSGFRAAKNKPLNF